MDHNQINAALVACTGTFDLPIGNHVVGGQITVPPGKRLRGLGKTPTTFAGIHPEWGSVLDVRWGGGAGSSGLVDRAAVILRAGATIENVGFDYSAMQPLNSAPQEMGSSVMPLDYNIGGLSQSVIGCCFFKSYIGADFRGSKTGQGVIGPVLRDNYGCPLLAGVWLDFLVDWGVIRDNMFNSGFIAGTDPNSPLRQWVASNGFAVRLGGNDWANIDNMQAWGYKCGVEIVGDSGYHATGPYRIRNCSFDACAYGVYVNNSTVYRQLISIEGNNFCCFNPYNGGGGIPLSLPSVHGVGLRYAGNYNFGPQKNCVIDASSSALGLIEITGNQGDNGNGQAWLYAPGSTSPIDQAHNQFRGFV